MCSVTGLESLNTTINLEWGNKYGNLVSSNAVLTFSPLLSSHGGYYYCLATVSTPYHESDFIYDRGWYITVGRKLTRKHG